MERFAKRPIAVGVVVPGFVPHDFGDVSVPHIDVVVALADELSDQLAHGPQCAESSCRVALEEHVKVTLTGHLRGDRRHVYTLTGHLYAGSNY